MKTRVLTIFGTRPEAIKLAPVVFELRRRPEFDTRVCVTGQHRQMLDQVLELFTIAPDYDLCVMRQDQGLSQLTSSILTALEPVLQREKPDIVVVQGDTTTALAASLAAFYRKIPVAHVEAGLRTRHLYNPYPEEVNRVLADALATWHFAPTEAARQNLLRDGYSRDHIHVTGNTVVDALTMARERVRVPDQERAIVAGLKQRYGLELDPYRRMLLVTGHRRESFGAEFESLCAGLLAIVKRNPDVQLVYPVHLNPQVRKPVESILGRTERVHLIEPVDYLEMVWLLDRCYLVLTDSGGIQEEAPVFGNPVLVLRNTTERPEGIAAGVARLVGTNAESIATMAQQLLDSEAAYRAMAHALSPYGDGQASRRIAEILAAFRMPADKRRLSIFGPRRSPEARMAARCH